MNSVSKVFTLAFFLTILAATSVEASITGSISGAVSDSSGAVVSGATVTATNIQTGMQITLKTDTKGFYNFAVLQIGTYTVEVQETGFKTAKRTDMAIDANSALRADFTLQVGQSVEQITVTAEAVHIETESTQMGEVITGKTMTAVPLNGRAYTDLLALQPGVSPYTATDSGTAGINDRPVDGGLNSGNQSVNGQRETANGFMVNGSNVEEGKNNGAAIIPNLDSIAEFRIITNNFDAEYGNYSGGQVNVVTKSGNNGLHGSGFEFLRNTALDAKNYFAAATDKTPVFRQNQFGGTLGGPIKKDKTFFFVDYQGTRQTQAPTVNTQMPDPGNFTGTFDPTSPFTNSNDANNNPVAATVGGQNFADLIAARQSLPAGTFQDGEPYYYTATTVDPTTIDQVTGIGTPYGSQCTTSSAKPCVFPGAMIPTGAWSPVATSMLNLGLIPKPNQGNFFNSSAYAQTLSDDKGGIRIDQNTRLGNFFGYYFIDNYTLNSPYPSGGATVPAGSFAYNGLTTGRAQLINLGYTKNIGSYSVNELRLSYVRNFLNLGQPQGGVGSNYSLSNLGFVTPWNATTGGISPIAPKLEGVPYITFNNFAIGVPQVTTRQYNNSFQVLDNFTKVFGTHTIKFGGQFHYDQINERNLAAENGQYSFTGGETGIDFADFLIGAPDSLTQASPQILDSRSKYYALYGQDSWRVTSNLVFNYGLRWEASMPWYDTQNKIETIIPGQQSVKFPGAPTGWVVAGDPGVPRTLAPTRWGNFSPRLGLAYSPGASSGFLGKLPVDPGKPVSASAPVCITPRSRTCHSSLKLATRRTVCITAVHSRRCWKPLTSSAPTDRRWDSVSPSLFLRPMFPRQNPDTTFPWPQVEPISYGFSFDHQNKLPYSEHYELSIQRQIGSGTVMSASYVGNQGHRLVTSIEANPANPALCLFLSHLLTLPPTARLVAPSARPRHSTPVPDQYSVCHGDQRKSSLRFGHWARSSTPTRM